MAEIQPRGRFRPPSGTERAVDSVNRHVHKVAGPRDLDVLVERVADADCIMLGEASHGTSEYYRWRAQITARLLREYDLSFVAVEGDEDSWNVRDRHMVRTLNRLLDHHGPDAKGIVWAHNTHVGDARATDMPRHGRINIGQLARGQDTIDDVALVGFGSDHGTVIAGRSWGSDMRAMDVPKSESGSYEGVFHRADAENALLFSDEVPDGDTLTEARGHRTIGVVYRPDHESGNYVPTVLPQRYDASLHSEEMSALHPVDRHPDSERVPELYPVGL